MPLPQKNRFRMKADVLRRGREAQINRTAAQAVARERRYADGVFKPNVRLDPSQVIDRRGESWYGPPNLDMNILQRAVRQTAMSLRDKIKP